MLKYFPAVLLLSLFSTTCLSDSQSWRDPEFQITYIWNTPEEEKTIKNHHKVCTDLAKIGNRAIQQKKAGQPLEKLIEEVMADKEIQKIEQHRLLEYQRILRDAYRWEGEHEYKYKLYIFAECIKERIPPYEEKY